jgi:hypothetical protein
MVDEGKSGMQCEEFEALLAEAVDGTLSGPPREEFERHRAGCAACNTLLAEVTSGAAWLDELVDTAPPGNLVHNILAVTSGAATSGAAPAVRVRPRVSRWERLRGELGMAFAPVLTPRFGMSMGMAFFSIMLVLDMAQIRIKDLTAHNLSHTFYRSENKVMKYYENTRLAYELESRVRELRQAGDESEREEKNRSLEKNNNQTEEQKSQPEGGEQRELSHERNALLLVGLSGSGPGAGIDMGINPGISPEMAARQRREL